MGIRIAAVGDVHAAEFTRGDIERTFAGIAERADVLLLAGDLTAHGMPDEAAILAGAVEAAGLPALTVLGNHDHHAGRAEEVEAVLREAGITVLERRSAVVTIGEETLGVAGLKGFVGGFEGSHLPDFGEPLLRRVYAETTADVDALDLLLGEIAECTHRVVLLHYAPTDETLAGEPPGIHAFLGSDRLAAPIRAHRPDLVLHGHAHMGTHEGAIGGVTVLNVAQPLLDERYVVVSLRRPDAGAGRFDTSQRGDTLRVPGLAR